MSTAVSHITRVPREFIDNYLFNFPDTSFAWAFALAVMAGALAARKRIAWWVLVVNLCVAIVFDITSLAEDSGSRFEDIGEFLGLSFHIIALAVLVAATTSSGPKCDAARCSRHGAVLVAVNVVGILLAWGLSNSSGLLQPDYRLPYAINRGWVRGGPRTSSSGGRRCSSTLFGLFGAVALMAAAIVLFQSQRAENALTGEDESAIRGLLEGGARTTHWGTSPPAGTSR